MSKQKDFKRYDEQIDFLIKEKGLIISDKSFAEDLLKRHSYFDLINGYKYPFKNNKTNKYKNGTTIDDIYYLYCFDDEIRYVLLKYIMEVEIHIKSLLSYCFCQQVGDAEKEYTDVTNYNYVDPYKNQINKLVQKIEETKKNYESFEYMKHQKNNHGSIPLWVLVKALTFGNISKMYSLQKPNIQTKISKEFIGANEGDLSSFLDLLTRFRNVCAHNERLFDYTYNKGCINDTKVHRVLFENEKQPYKKGKQDFFGAVIALKYLLCEASFSKLVEDIDCSIENLFKKTHQIQRQQLYKYMGLPNNWKNIKNINLSESR